MFKNLKSAYPVNLDSLDGNKFYYNEQLRPWILKRSSLVWHLTLLFKLNGYLFSCPIAFWLILLLFIP